MTKRQKRVQKILEIREKHLDQSANQLTRARQLAEQAERALEEQQRRTQEANKEREEMAQRPVTAHEWIDSESWRMRLGNQERVLSEKAARAQVVVQQYEETAKAIEAMAADLIEMQKRVEQETATIHCVIGELRETAQRARDEGKAAFENIERMSRMSQEVRATCEGIRLKLTPQ